MAPSADARITTSSVHPKRNAGNRPNPSRMYTYTPPERGNSAASSAYVSAPHNASRPPSTHTPNIGSGAGTRSAMTAGVRKIPPPMVEPTSTAIALQKPSRRGSRSPGGPAGRSGGRGGRGHERPNILRVGRLEAANSLERCGSRRRGVLGRTPTLHGSCDLRQPGERAPGAGVEVLRGMPRPLERLHHYAFGRRRVDERGVDLGVQR